METADKPKWYKRNGVLIALAIFFGLFAFSSAQYDDNPTTNTVQVQSQTSTIPTYQPAPQTQTETQVESTQNNGLSNDTYYTNTKGNTVHSPAYSATIPEGASARCGDGTYSFSQSRRGTCSHHGGVSSWL
jgi:hypothetical protein